jgi:DNA-binding transcriptional regulator YbjK
MMNRRELVLDAAISVLGDHGVRAVTHRAVDAAAALPEGSTSNHFRTRDALFDGIVERFVARERANWEALAARLDPRSPADLAQALAEFAREATTKYKTLTLARYAILVEAARRPSLRERLATGGAEVNAYFSTWLRMAGSAHPERDMHLILNYVTGLILHELAMPDPEFHPGPKLIALFECLIPARPRSVSRSRRAALR